MIFVGYILTHMEEYLGEFSSSVGTSIRAVPIE